MKSAEIKLNKIFSKLLSVRTAAVILSAALLITSCEGFFDILTDSDNAKVVFTLESADSTDAASQSRTVNPLIAVTDFTGITITYQEAADTSPTTLVSSQDYDDVNNVSYTIPIGTYTFTATAVVNEITYQATTTGQTFTKGSTNTIPLSFTRASTTTAVAGTGYIDVEFTLNDSNVNGVKAALYEPSTDTYKIASTTLTISGGTFAYVIGEGSSIATSVDTGTYRLMVELYSDAACTLLIGTYNETVNVSSGFTSSASRTITDATASVYTVTYNTNGGTLASGVTIPSSVTRFTEYTLPVAADIIRTGYNFEGWYTDSTFTADSKITQLTNINSDINLYARWVTYKVDWITSNITLASDGSSYTKRLYAVAQSASKIVIGDSTTYASAVTSLTKYRAGETSEDDVFAYFDPTASNPELYVLAEGRIVFEDDDYSTTNSVYVFENCTNATEIILSNIDTSLMTSMIKMFSGCSKVTSLDLSGFNTSSVTKMSNMFENCTKLTSIDLSSFDTSSVTFMSYMFSGCSSLTSLDVSSFNTAMTQKMSSMFNNCSSLTTLDISNFSTSKVKDMCYMFNGCSSLATLNFDTSKFVTTKVEVFDYMFGNCSNLTSLDVSGFNTTAATSMSGMFKNCSKLTTINVSGFTTCGADPSDEDNVGVSYMHEMFYGCSSVTQLDLTSFNTKYVENMSDMFYGCTSLTTIKGLTSSDKNTNFTTSAVENFSHMFTNCSALTELDLSNFNTSAATTIYEMFRGCTSLRILYIANFTTTNITTLANLFYGCESLVYIDGFTSWNTANVTTYNSMFYNCKALTQVDLKPFSWACTSANYSYMFYNCSSLVDIYVASGTNLRTVLVDNDNPTNLFYGYNRSVSMFGNCTSLTGAISTTYSSYNVDYMSACIDDGAGTAGYFKTY